MANASRPIRYGAIVWTCCSITLSRSAKVKHSPQPTRPPSVSSFTNRQFRATPGDTRNVWTRAIFISRNETGPCYVPGLLLGECLIHLLQWELMRDDLVERVFVSRAPEHVNRPAEMAASPVIVPVDRDVPGYPLLGIARVAHVRPSAPTPD